MRIPLAIVVAAMVVCTGFPAHAQNGAPQDKRVDAAIVRALEFLSREQHDSGAWAAGRSSRRRGRTGESTAATSLAIMAFLAAGHVPGEGPYAKHLEKGVDWILDQQVTISRRQGRETVVLVRRGVDRTMYSHGISTLMLAEVSGMLKGRRRERCREVLQKSVRLILEAQAVRKASNHKGGWRYEPSSHDSDLSVTGWQLLALRAAKDIGCDVPKSSIDSAVAYVKRCRPRGSGGFSYQPNNSPSATRMGTGILCLEVCGEHKSNEAVAAAEYLMVRPLRQHESWFYYGVYYCTVGMFKMGGKYWESARDNIHQLLLSTQERDGSWTRGGTDSRYGPVYCTSMSVLALAVEYRYLPIYQR